MFCVKQSRTKLILINRYNIEDICYRLESYFREVVSFFSRYFTLQFTIFKTNVKFLTYCKNKKSVFFDRQSSCFIHN